MNENIADLKGNASIKRRESTARLRATCKGRLLRVCRVTLALASFAGFLLASNFADGAEPIAAPGESNAEASADELVMGFRARPCLDGVEIVGYEGELGEMLVVPEKLDGRPVRKIGNHAFAGRQSLQTVKLPEGLQCIGTSAFLGCRALERVETPDSVKEIEDNVFYQCTGLTEITIPDSVTSIKATPHSCKTAPKVV